MTESVTKSDGALRERLMVLNALLDRASLIGAANTPRDIDSECGYPTGYVPRQLYQDLYDYEPIPARVVDVFPKESWQVQPAVYEDEDPDTETEFEAAWNDLPQSIRVEKSYHQDQVGNVIWEYLHRVDKLSGIGHYGIILLGLDDGLNLSQPAQFVADALPAQVELEGGGGPWSPIPGTPEAGMVGEGSNGTGGNGRVPRPVASPRGFAGGARRTWSWNANGNGRKSARTRRKLTFLRVFPESMAWISQFDSNPTSPRFGQPTEYTIQQVDPVSQSQGAGLEVTTTTVHWTRVIHVADSLGASEVYGVPRMQQVLHRLLDLRKLYGGSGEMYWRGAFPGYALETLPQLGSEVDIDEEKVRKMMWDWANGLQRYITLTGLSIKGLAPQVVDPSPQVQTQIEAICIQIGVPVRIFKGSERGELASSQDDDAWCDRIAQRQHGYLTPRLVVPFVDRLINLGVLPAPGGYSVSWPDLKTRGDTDKAAVGAQRTTALVAYGNSQGSQDLITPVDYWTKIQAFDDATAQSIVDNAEKEKARREKEQQQQQAEQLRQQQAQADDQHRKSLELLKAKGPEQPPQQPGDQPLPGGPGGNNGGDGGASVDTQQAGREVSTTNDDPALNTNAELTGGKWITLEGAHVYIKDGKVVTGPDRLRGTDIGAAHAPAARSGEGGQFSSGGITGGGAQSYRSFARGDEGERWGFEHYDSDKWLDRLSADEQKALVNYVGNSESINNELRGRAVDQYGKGAAARWSPGIDSALAKGKTPEGVVVWRGVAGHAAREWEVGATHTDPGYTSTTVDPIEAREHADTAADGGAMLRLHVPKGTPAGYLGVGDFGSPERELLLGRGLTFRVTAIHEPDAAGNPLKGGYRVVDMEVKPHHAEVHNYDPDGPPVGATSPAPHEPPDTLLPPGGPQVGIIFDLDLGSILDVVEPAVNAVAAGSNPWAAYVGPRGGRGWKNANTGRIVYGPTQPGLGRGIVPAPTGSGTPPAPAITPAAGTATGQPKAQRADPASVKAHIARLLVNPSKITPDHIREVKEQLLSMTVAQIHAVRKDLGLKASGVKADLAVKVAQRALAGLGKPQPQSPMPVQHPTPTPPQHQSPAPAVAPSQHPASAPIPPQHQPPTPAQHPMPVIAPGQHSQPPPQHRPPTSATTPTQPPGATRPSSLHRGANVISGTPATPRLPTVPRKDEIEWSTGKPQPGTLNGVDFAPAPPRFWEKVKDKDVGEPPPTRPIARAGVMVQEPDGRIWIAKPTNEYGDRKYTLPGGGVEHGLTHQQNAMKEVWEETGLQVEITGHLGDFRDSNNGNIGRLYIGKRVGGAPWDAKVEPHIIDEKTGKPAAESSEVVLTTPERARKLLHRTDDLAQLMTVAPPPVGTATRGKGSQALIKFVEAIEPATKDFLSKQKAAGSDKPGNGELHAVQEIRGFNEKPKVVSKNDMDTLLAGGDHIEMLRGLGPHGKNSASDLAKQFREGDHYPGFGCFGSGTYADSTKGYANLASNYAGQGTDSAMMRIALPKTARIIKQSELEKKVPINPEEFKGYEDTQGSYSAREEWHGVHAALAGYDAIEVDGKSSHHYSYGKGYYVILNRSVLTVQKEDAKGHKIP